MTTLDAHQHFWRYDPVRYGWIDASMSVLQRDFLPEDLAPLLERHQLGGCVAVQAEQSEQETDFLLQLAENHDFIQAVVGWTDLRSERVAERLAHFSQFKKLAGFRHIVQAERDERFLLRPDFCRGIAELERHGFTYDILVFPHQLEAVLAFVRRFPQQPFVIDHCAKPYIKDGRFKDWARLMRQIGAEKNVHCKLSGLVTEADWQRWRYEDFVLYLDLVLDSFGPGRLMFGSDWPVCLLAAEYGEVLGIVRDFIANLSAAEQAMVMGETAAKFYNVALAV